MKKIFSLLAVMMTFTALHAQLPNASFENWTLSPDSTYEDPNQWNTSNEFTTNSMLGSGAAPLVNKTSTSATGSFAAELQVKTFQVPNPLGGTFNITIPGVITNGTINVDLSNPLSLLPLLSGFDFNNLISGGSAYTERPTHFEGSYIFNPQGNDTSGIIVRLTKWVGGTKEVVAEGSLMTTTPAPTYTNFSIPLDYNGSNLCPDSILIIILAASNTQGTNGTITVVDDIALTGNAGNGAPVANDETVSTPFNTPVSVNVKANDEDCDGLIANATITITQPPANGTATLTGTDSITYTPDATFSGSDVITYQLCDEGSPAECDEADVTITVLSSIYEAGWNSTLSVYPNPANTAVHITSEKTLTASKVTIHNVIGAVVAEADFNGNEVKINVSELNNGLYFFQLTGNNNEMIGKGKFNVAR